MNHEDILYHRLHGIISFLANNMSDDQVEEAFNMFVELGFDNKLYIEDLCLYHNSPLYRRIRQYFAETGCC